MTEILVILFKGCSRQLMEPGRSWFQVGYSVAVHSGPAETLLRFSQCEQQEDGQLTSRTSRWITETDLGTVSKLLGINILLQNNCNIFHVMWPSDSNPGADCICKLDEWDTALSTILKCFLYFIWTLIWRFFFLNSFHVMWPTDFWNTQEVNIFLNSNVNFYTNIVLDSHS